MSLPPRPWFRVPPAGPGRLSQGAVLGAGWLMCALAVWAFLGTRSVLVGLRPPVVVEAFVSDLASADMIEEMAEEARSQPFCCDARFVSAEEARAEAAKEERVRRLLEAFGGNPFLRSIRISLCPDSLEDYDEAVAWFKLTDAVLRVRVPETKLKGVLSSERVIRRAVTTGAVAAAFLGLLIAGLGMRFLAGAAWAEVEVLERLGASLSRVFIRILWAAGVPGVVTAVLVFLGVEVLSLLARFSSGWLISLGWAGRWVARLPDFPFVAGGVLFAAALALSLIVALAVLFRRVFARTG